MIAHINKAKSLHVLVSYDEKAQICYIITTYEPATRYFLEDLITRKKNDSRCPICQGYKQNSFTTFTVDLKFGIIVVRDVPAMICEQCGEEWIADKEVGQLETIVNDARQKHSMIEVANFSDLLRVAS